MTMLEAMAKAAYEADGDAGIRIPPWIILSTNHPLRTLKISQVVAALKVLREPTEEKAEAIRQCLATWSEDKTWDDYQEIFRAQIDAVLAEAS